MKKALIISNITKRFQAGHFSMITPLEELGYEVHWAANFSEYKEDIEKVPCKIHQIDFIRNPFNPKNYKAYKQLMNLLKKEQFDIIHCQSPIGGVLGRICGKKTKMRKVIYTAHGFHFYKGAPWINNTLYKTVEFQLAHKTDAIITMNEEDYQSAQKMKLRVDGQIYKIHGIGIETKKFVINKFDYENYKKEIGLNKDDIMLISMGDLIKRKNYNMAIKAIAECNNPRLHYIICGDGPEGENLKRMAEDLGLKEQIHFLGFRTDIKELLNCADIFLFTTYQEGLPRSMMEAMSVGIPCIASEIRGNVDLIDDGKGGYLVSPNDVKQIAGKIEILSKSEKMRKDMGEYNQKKVKQFDIENVKKEMKKIYEEVIK